MVIDVGENGSKVASNKAAQDGRPCTIQAKEERIPSAVIPAFSGAMSLLSQLDFKFPVLCLSLLRRTCMHPKAKRTKKELSSSFTHTNWQKEQTH